VSPDIRSHRWSFILDEPARILFADDDPILTEFAKVYLSTPVATVESAADGHEAWRRLSEEHFDIALIDIEMPGLGGFAVVERIRADARLRHLPVVMVTGHDDVVSIDRAFEAGATSFVTKPVNWRQLSYQMRYVLRMSRLEAGSRAARERAEQASMLKSTILSIIHHEMRTPLNSIIGFSGLLAQETPGRIDNPVYRDYVAQIHAAGHQLHDRLADMLQYAELAFGERAPAEDEYRLAALADAAVAAVAPQAAEAGIAIALAGPAEQINVICDRDLLVRALQHLLVNAVLHGAGPITLAITHSADGLAFAVTDCGPGLSADQIDRAVTVQAEDGSQRDLRGLGLGLPIARRIAELHGGRLELVSGTTAGATVRIILPPDRVILSGPPLVAAAPPPRPAVAAATLAAEA
jgi:two-component system sensor histidine kinase/response regulator